MVKVSQLTIPRILLDLIAVVHVCALGRLYSPYGTEAGVQNCS